MKCLTPRLIKNKYTAEYMYVPCGKCDACLTSDSVCRSAALANDMLNYSINVFVTLTYDNYNIPFVIVGRSGIFRVSSDRVNFVRVEDTDKDITLSKPFTIRGFDSFDFGRINKCVGVIYYRDFQLFFKRLRKKFYQYYGKTDVFRFYICCEYGSVYFRPHAHIILQFSERRFAEDCYRFVPQCWQMCDWSRISDCIKVCQGGISSYVSSYVNSNSCRNEVSRIKRFRPFKKRSKNLNFGFKSEIFEKIKIIVNKYYGQKFPDFCESDFRYVQDEFIGHVSSCLVPKSYFNPYFHKPKGFCDLSFKSFRLLCYSLYGYYGQRDKLKYRSFGGITFDFSSDDKLFILRYFNFCRDFAFVDNFETFDAYVTFIYRLFVYYDSLVIKESMLMYEFLGKYDYLTYCYNTFTPSVSYHRRRNILRTLDIPSDYIGDKEFYTAREKKDIEVSVHKYRNFLMPKHFNSLINKL